jgi:hypothetical protein
MKPVETTSWIFLALSISSEKESACFSEISQIADGINHALPTQKEMQTSLSWLIKQKLAEKVANKYLLTEVGKRIYEETQKENLTLIKIWKSIESKFVSEFGNTQNVV